MVDTVNYRAASMTGNRIQAVPSRRTLRSLALLPIVALVGACAVGTPVDTRKLRDSAAAATPTLEVSITHAVIDPARRGDFDRWTRRVNAGLDAQPGLLAHAIRKELFGDKVWTFTVWASAADRDRFVRSTTHQRAMDAASTGIAAMRSVRLTLAPAELPTDWDGVLALLDRATADGQARSYGAPGAD
jgi:heme-degrading monooxygenase HmoA